MSYKGKMSEKSNSHTDARKKLIVMPTLKDRGGDLKKEWYVEYQYFDYIKGGMRRFRISKGINEFSTDIERREAAAQIIKEYKRMLNNGWNPFENKDIIYSGLEHSEKIKETNRQLQKGKISINTLIDRFLEEHKPPKKKASTYDGYKSKLKIFKDWLTDKKLIDKHPVHFTQQDASVFFDYLLKEREVNIRGDIKIGVSKSSYNVFRIVLDRLFNYIIEQKKLKINPIAQLKLFRQERNLPKWYNDRMIKTITSYLSDHDYQMLIVVKFIYYTYLRPRELRMLKIKDINIWEGTVTIPKEISKNGRNQKVTIPDVFLDELTNLGWNKLDRDNYLFSLEKVPGKAQVGINYFSKRYRKYLNKLGIPEEYELYHWKHTGAATAMEQGINVESIRQQMRHQDLRTTQQYLESMISGKTSEFKTKHKPI